MCVGFFLLKVANERRGRRERVFFYARDFFCFLNWFFQVLLDFLDSLKSIEGKSDPGDQHSTAHTNTVQSWQVTGLLQ